MKLKVRPADFKVIERLAEGVISDGGAHRVYRVKKEKVTSMEAATEIAHALGISAGDVAMAGLKDRQGVTVQYMSVHRGPTLSLGHHGLSVQDVGFSAEPLHSEHSLGNEFQIVVRDLGDDDVDRAREALEAVRSHGLPNYFDSQRFGNLRHGQGWIVLDLLKGDLSGALKRLVASASPHEPPARRNLKDALWRAWGDWPNCRSIAGKLGRYHSVFEHLKRDPEDFEGAFHRVGTRERLIHLYAFQSHLFNRALALWTKENAGLIDSIRGVEGPLRFPAGELPLPASWEGQLMMPGERLEGLRDDVERDLYARVMAAFDLEPDGLALPDVPGFQLKPEPRPAVVRPEGLRMRPAEDDNLFRGRRQLKLKFSLPRGAYATLVVQRLVGTTISGGPDGRDGGRDGGGAPRHRRRGGGRRGSTRGSTRGGRGAGRGRGRGRRSRSRRRG